MFRLELVTELLSSLLFLLHCSDHPCASMAHSSFLVPQTCIVFRRLQELVQSASHPVIYWEIGATVKAVEG